MAEETIKTDEEIALEKSTDEVENEEIVLKGDDEKVQTPDTDALVKAAQDEAKEAQDALAAYREENDIAAKEEATKAMNTFIYDQVGGEDKLKKLGEYLKSRIPATEMELINAKLASGNKGIVKEALAAAVKQYNTLRGVHTIMEGDPATPEQGFVHVTKDAYYKIIVSDKYKSDPIYASRMDDMRLKSKAMDDAKYGKGQYWGTSPSGQKYAL